MSVSSSVPSVLSRQHDGPLIGDASHLDAAAIPVDRPHRVRSASIRTDAPPPTLHASSFNQRTPARSFVKRNFHGSIDPAQYSSQGLREHTAELASFALSDAESAASGNSLPGPSNNALPSMEIFSSTTTQDHDHTEPRPTEGRPRLPAQRPSSSALTALIRNSPPEEEDEPEGGRETDPELCVTADGDPADETTSLIRRHRRPSEDQNYGTSADVENQVLSQKSRPRAWQPHLSQARRVFRTLSNPKSWNRRAVWQHGIVKPVSLLPAVFLGLLLNILDALSYGMILFPLGQPLFADLGADGISMFYVSTIISQLVFSLGGSIFRGGIGSEMIEVVPFFHKMAFMIINRVGEDNPKSVIATTILSYAISSVLTGLVFFIMGACRLGSLIGFFPRHILIGCIGGVGYFLVVTGLEVSARLPGNLEYDLATLRHLFQLDTFPLWMIPLALAVGLLILKRFIKSNFLVGGYFIAVGALFYIVKAIAHVSMDALRQKGWLFEAPSSENPWYHFYTLYDFSAVNWSALLETVPAMFALTFFGILHVPINVPALGISTGEDNLNVDRELIAHGVSNALSGVSGSIQNYLVYTNSLLFMASGGTSRLAGVMLAIATGGVLVIGPVLIGFIPIMVVGALIFMLGIELMEEALVDTWGKLHRLEYLTVLIIVVTMGAWDFVVGIFVGIVLACVNFVVQTSRKSAIRGTYSGQVARSTVRRHPIQLRFLKRAGQQLLVIKVAGFLFFGTIVSVEKTIRGLIEEEAFTERPIRYLVLDLAHVDGLDFSAAEAFTRMNRILGKRNVEMVVCGIDIQGEIGQNLQTVGLFGEENEVPLFEELNSALEYCENSLLEVLYYRTAALTSRGEPEFSHSLDVPKTRSRTSFTDILTNSPRRHYLQQAAIATLNDEESTAAGLPTSKPNKWANFKQPLPLLLQTFQGFTDKNEDFWFPLCAYFSRAFFPAGSVLYYDKDVPDSFYLLESGMLRAEYKLPQGAYYELIVAGRPCGELPFFGETSRTATVRAEQSCIVWHLTRDKWVELQRTEKEISQELLRVCLKLTTERMDSITSYVLTAAG